MNKKLVFVTAMFAGFISDESFAKIIELIVEDSDYDTGEEVTVPVPVISTDSPQTREMNLDDVEQSSSDSWLNLEDYQGKFDDEWKTFFLLESKELGEEVVKALNVLEIKDAEEHLLKAKEKHKHISDMIKELEEAAEEEKRKKTISTGGSGGPIKTKTSAVKSAVPEPKKPAMSIKDRAAAAMAKMKR